MAAYVDYTGPETATSEFLQSKVGKPSLSIYNDWANAFAGLISTKKHKTLIETITNGMKQHVLIGEDS